MNIVTFQHNALYGGEVRVPANVPAVVPWAAYRSLRRVCLQQGLGEPRVSGLGHYVRPFCGQDLNGRRLLAWRGCGIGDLLMWSGVLRAVKHRWPDATIGWYIHPGLVDLFRGVDFATVLSEPIPFAAFRAFDYHLLGEDLCEADCEPDQPCTWDAQLARAGLDPATVPPELKRPAVPVTDADRKAAAAWLQTAGAGSAPVVLWQLAASNHQRCYPPVQTRAALHALREAVPAETAIVIVGRDVDFRAYPRLPQLPNVHRFVDQPFRTLYGLVECAALVICPDSSIGHLAAAFPAVPVLSLWGPFDPRDRIAYYPNHRPLRTPLPCVPCRAHRYQRCPLRGRHWCRALAGIRPETIAAEAAAMLVHPQATQTERTATP